MQLRKTHTMSKGAKNIFQSKGKGYIYVSLYQAHKSIVEDIDLSGANADATYLIERPSWGIQSMTLLTPVSFSTQIFSNGKAGLTYVDITS